MTLQCVCASPSWVIYSEASSAVCLSVAQAITCHIDGSSQLMSDEGHRLQLLMRHLLRMLVCAALCSSSAPMLRWLLQDAIAVDVCTAAGRIE